MEHKGSNTDNRLATLFTTEEIELSQVLLQLPYPVSYSDYRHNVLNVNWGRTRNRITQPSEPINGASASASATATATSPPLAAAPVCCRPPPPRKKRRPRSKEHWEEMIKELTVRRELLKRKIGKVEAYYEKLKAINSE